MTPFKKTGHQTVKADKPYDSYILNRIDDNNRYLRAERGSHYNLVYKAGGNGSTGYQRYRPLCSVSGFASFLQVPYYVHRSLIRLELSAIVRVGCGPHEAGFAPLLTVPAFLRMALLGADAGASIQVTPNISKGTFGWVYVKFHLDIPSSAPRDLYDTVSIQMKSEIPNQALANTSSGVINSSNIDLGVDSLPERVKTSAALYPLGTAGTAPNAEDNEVTATILSTSTGTDSLASVADHMFMASSGLTMRVHPPQRLLGMRPAFDDPDQNGARKAWKTYASYLQVRSLEIREVHSEGEA